MERKLGGKLTSTKWRRINAQKSTRAVIQRPAVRFKQERDGRHEKAQKQTNSPTEA